MAIGIPGSGKTTFLKQLPEFRSAIYICPDDIREELLGDAADQSQNETVWAEAHKRMVSALDSGKTVILDSTQTIPEHRRHEISLAKESKADVIGYYFKTPLEIALERNKKRERKVPEDVITDLQKRLRVTPPTLGEGFTEIIVIES